MTAIDHVLGIDWSDATYVGDGVYLQDATDYMGIPALAIRTDREFNQHVIVFEADIFDTLVRRGRDILAANALGQVQEVIPRPARIRIEGWHRARCQWCGAERPLNRLFEKDGLLSCYWFCANNVRPDLGEYTDELGHSQGDVLLRSKAAWMQGFVGGGYTAHLPRNFIYRWNAARCDLCGTSRPYAPGYIGEVFWRMVCKGGVCPSLPRPEVPA